MYVSSVKCPTYFKIIGFSGLGFISGGLIYNHSFELYNFYYHKKKVNNVNLFKDLINIGSYLGLLIGFFYGYFEKPLLPLMIDNIALKGNKR